MARRTRYGSCERLDLQVALYLPQIVIQAQEPPPLDRPLEHRHSLNRGGRDLENIRGRSKCHIPGYCAKRIGQRFISQAPFRPRPGTLVPMESQIYATCIRIIKAAIFFLRCCFALT